MPDDITSLFCLKREYRGLISSPSLPTAQHQKYEYCVETPIIIINNSSREQVASLMLTCTIPINLVYERYPPPLAYQRHIADVSHALLSGNGVWNTAAGSFLTYVHFQWPSSRTLTFWVLPRVRSLFGPFLAYVTFICWVLSRVRPLSVAGMLVEFTISFRKSGITKQ